MEMLTPFYSLFKTIHIISIVSWFAMLFYLPRLFVYHSANKNNKEFIKIVELQERRLYKYIGSPAMIVSIISGILLILSMPGILSSGGWLHTKILLVIFLLIYHFLCGKYIRDFVNNKFGSEKFFRIFNEVPTILLILIVVMVVFKPF